MTPATLLLQLVPLSDLLAGTVHHLVPVMRLLSAELGADLKASDHLVLGHPVPVEREELDADVVQSLVARYVEQERLVEHRVQRSLLHVRFLLGDALTVVQQVYLHVRVCKQKI